MGCENCDGILRMKGSIDRVGECTSPQFTGLVGAANTSGESSWVVRWQRIEDLIPGVYAVSVQGRLPEDIQAMLEQKGVYYRPRDNYA